MNYRLLYFFHGKATAVLCQGLVKEVRIPPKEIDRASERMKRFSTSPESHTFEE